MIKGLDEYTELVVDLKRRLKVYEATIIELEQLPSILDTIGVDTWFCIFKQLKSPKDILRCSRVCKTWKKCIEKYKSKLSTESKTYLQLYSLLGTVWPNAPLFVTSIGNKKNLYILLIEKSKSYWTTLFNQIAANYSFGFENNNRIMRITHRDPNVDINLIIDITIACSSSFKCLEFLPNQLNIGAILSLKIMVNNNNKTASCVVYPGGIKELLK
jgi:hypothetical protein